MASLTYTILDERRVQKWQDYMAVAVWRLGRVLGGDNWNITPYTDFAYPEKATPVKTPSQIKEDIVRRLTT